ncbi:MAG: PucR family transcriptional regulator [Vulcanimicrobiaceae bacterium]
MKLHDALRLDALKRATVVAGGAGLGREVRWVHLVDHPDIVPWVRAGQLLLTTGFNWPRTDNEQSSLIDALCSRGLGGVCLAVPEFLEHFPLATITAAEIRGLPLIEIPWEIPFSQITEELHTVILNEQATTIARSEAVHRTLTGAALDARGLQGLAASLSGLIERAVIIRDTESRVLAAYPDTRQVRDETAGVIQPIRARGEIVGTVWAAEANHPLNDLEVRALEQAAMVAAVYVVHQRELAALEARLGYAFFDALFEGHFVSTPEALERAVLFGFDQHAAYRVAILTLDEEVPLSRDGFFRREQMANRVRRRLSDLEAPALLSVSLNHIRFLVPEERSGARLWEVVGSARVALVLSCSHRGVAGVRRAAGEALDLLPHHEFGQFQEYETLLLPRALQGDVEAREAFLREMLGALRSKRRGEALLTTLFALADDGFQINRTAQALGIHVSTLRYRLEQIADLTGFDLENPETRFRIQLAARFARLGTKPNK